MTAFYRFPDMLGSGEYEEHRSPSGGTEAPVGTVAFHINGCLVCVAKNLLTEVPPALPPEPEPWSVVQTGAAFFERRGGEGIGWYNIGGHTFVTWEQICSGGPPVRLVPDPFAEPVTLPWSLADESRAHRSEVEAVRGGEVRDVNRAVGEYAVGVLLPPDGARAKARALWAAADAAEAQR